MGPVNVKTASIVVSNHPKYHLMWALKLFYNMWECQNWHNSALKLAALRERQHYTASKYWSRWCWSGILASSFRCSNEKTLIVQRRCYKNNNSCQIDTKWRTKIADTFSPNKLQRYLTISHRLLFAETAVSPFLRGEVTSLTDDPGR